MFNLLKSEVGYILDLRPCWNLDGPTWAENVIYFYTVLVENQVISTKFINYNITFLIKGFERVNFNDL